MFGNIGGKIKGLTKIICWIEIIICVIVGIAFMVNGGPGYGVVIIIVGSLLAWVGSFVLYGFGELVENSTYLANHFGKKKNEEDNSEEKVSENNTQSDTYLFYCKQCNELWKGSSHLLSSEKKCPRCNGQTLNTGLTLDQWKALSENEKEEHKKKWAEK